MNKTGLVLGIIGTVLGVITSGISSLIVLVFSIALNLTNSATLSYILQILLYINFASIILAIVALCLYRKSVVSSVLMFISTFLYILLYVYLLILSGFTTTSFVILFGFIPAILMLISSIFTLKNRTKTNFLSVENKQNP